MNQMIDVPLLRALRPEIEAALQPLAERYEISMKVGRGTCTRVTGHLKIEIAAIGESGEAFSVEGEAFKREVRFMNGLTADDLGAEFTDLDGERCRLVGCMPRSTKYPMLVEKISTGKRYKYPLHLVVTRLSAERKKPSAEAEQ